MKLELLLESVHGHVGVLAAAALLHPAILLRKGKPLTSRNRWSVAGATLFSVAAFSTGILIYEDYRAQVKRPMFLASFRAGTLFEIKEHLAVIVISLALGALVCAWVAPRDGNSLRKAAAHSYAMAAILCAAVVAMGTYVAAVQGF